MAGKGPNSTSFKKGTAKGRPKGAKNHRKKVVSNMGVSGWADLQGWVEGAGLTKCIQEISTLQGKEFEQAYGRLAEFIKPKLARSEQIVKADLNVNWEETRSYENPDLAKPE